MWCKNRSRPVPTRLWAAIGCFSHLSAPPSMFCLSIYMSVDWSPQSPPSCGEPVGLQRVEPLLLFGRCYLRSEALRQGGWWRGRDRRQICVEWNKGQRSPERARSKAAPMCLAVSKAMWLNRDSPTDKTEPHPSYSGRGCLVSCTENNAASVWFISLLEKIIA